MHINAYYSNACVVKEKKNFKGLKKSGKFERDQNHMI